MEHGRLPRFKRGMGMGSGRGVHQIERKKEGMKVRNKQNEQLGVCERVYVRACQHRGDLGVRERERRKEGRSCRLDNDS